ncbi:methionyl-tRNA formyltransferase, partial [Escherichia coli]|nr:methionyl-tRNA formyltransferase [Escherichia coli]
MAVSIAGSSIGIKTPKRVKKHHKTDVSSTPL